jgi:hypothetical protein
LTEVGDALSRGGLVTCVTGRKYDGLNRRDTSLVVALHHHPILPGVQPGVPSATGLIGRYRAWRKRIKEDLCELANAEDFRKVCVSAGVDVVIFGHQHLRYHVVDQGVFYSCCPASTAFTEDRNPPWSSEAVDKQPGFLEYTFDRTKTGSYGIVGIEERRFEYDGAGNYSFVRRDVLSVSAHGSVMEQMRSYQPS